MDAGERNGPARGNILPPPLIFDFPNKTIKLGGKYKIRKYKIRRVYNLCSVVAVEDFALDFWSVSLVVAVIAEGL